MPTFAGQPLPLLQVRKPDSEGGLTASWPFSLQGLGVFWNEAREAAAASGLRPPA